MREKPNVEMKNYVSSEKKASTPRGELNTREHKEKVMLDFVVACGDVRFIKKIAAGKDVSKDAALIEAAKKALSEWETVQSPRGCYDPYRTLSEVSSGS